MRRPDYGVQPVTVVFGGIGSQRGNQLVVEERARIDIDAEILQQTLVHLPKVGRGAHRGHDTLVISVRRRVIQFAVGFHHILPDPLAQAEDIRPETQQKVLLKDVYAPLDIQVRLVGGNSLLVHRCKKPDAGHQRISPQLLHVGGRGSRALLGTQSGGPKEAPC